MKKRILSVLCMLGLVIGLIPVTVMAAGAAEPETSTYSYAYDAQRDPTFPASKGAEITASSFKKPLKHGSVTGSGSTYDSNAGTWKLTKMGTYSDKTSFNPQPASYLDDVVGRIAENYGLGDEGKNGLVIHKLTNGEELVGYGVVVAVDETKGYALFIGDLWNNNGAGYLLSKNSISATSVTFNAEQMAQSTYSVSLSPATVSFDGVQTGYAAPAAKTITVTNTGDAATGDLTVELSGTGADKFTLSTTTIGSIAVGGSNTFTVVPNTGLGAGNYTAMITVKGTNVLPETVSVTFSVTAPTTYAVTLNAQGGTIANDKNVTSYIFGTGATLPTADDVTKTGHTFGGWYTTDAPGEGDAAVTAIGTTDTGNKTYYAKWTANVYTVTLAAQGGTGAPTSIQVTYGGTYAGLVSPTRSGYTFDGWFTAAEGGSEVKSSNTVSITAAQTLYAHWTLNSDAELEDVAFTHAYDAQRSPSFPAKNDEITLHSLAYPLDANGEHGSENTGDWKLTRVGAYYNVKNTAKDSDKLQAVVNGIARSYTGITTDEIVIHELKNGGTHVAYGVVVAYDAASGRAVFLGDTWNDGAGYLLATSAQDGTVQMTATAVPADFVQAAEYRIALDKTGTYAFAAATAGYVAQSPVTVTVTNVGSAATGALTVTLTGADAGKFTLSKTTIASLDVAGNAAFTVVPVAGLAAGSYTATVTVGGDNVVPKSFGVTFTVNAAAVNVPYVKPAHTCTSRCEICGKCMDQSCTEAVCTDKCVGGVNVFADVAENKWYTEAVKYVYHRGMMDGVGNGRFDIEGTTTRAMIVTILWRLEGEPAVDAPMQFDDVPAAEWYAEAVRWAASEGLVEGWNGKFDPMGAITREQFAAILWRYAKYKGYDVGVGEDTDILDYGDAGSVSEYAVSAMQWICGTGLMEGDGAKLIPEATATRAQAAVLFQRFCEKIIK